MKLCALDSGVFKRIGGSQDVRTANLEFGAHIDMQANVSAICACGRDEACFRKLPNPSEIKPPSALLVDRLLPDFNAMTPDDICWLLVYGDTALEKLADELHLKRGDKVTLFQDENDFEVTATLDFRHVEFLARETWVAVPDWSTIVDL